MPATSTTTGLTRPEKITILKHLLNDRETDWIAAATGSTADQVNTVKRDHGYPDPAKMRWALDILENQTDSIPTRNGRDPALIRTGQPRPIPAPAPARPSPPARPVEEPEQTAGYLQDLLARGRASSKTRTRTLATKVADQIERLTQALDDEERAARAAEKAAKAEAERQAKIAALQAELEALGATAPKKPRAKRESSTRITRGEYPCPADGCDRVLDTPQGLSAHRRRAHEGWNPKST